MSRIAALRLLSSEELTVSTSAKAITAATYAGNAVKAYFEHISGGKVWHTDNRINSSISNAGANGEISENIGTKWSISGTENIEHWRSIRDTGASSDGVVNVNVYGSD